MVSVSHGCGRGGRSPRRADRDLGGEDFTVYTDVGQRSAIGGAVLQFIAPLTSKWCWDSDLESKLVTNLLFVCALDLGMYFN